MSLLINGDLQKHKQKSLQKKMQDPEFAADYYARKAEKAEKKRTGSKYNYSTAGGRYVPTKDQYDFCVRHPELFVTEEEKTAENLVVGAYAVNQKVHHDYIHIVNELIRKHSNLSW